MDPFNDNENKVDKKKSLIQEEQDNFQSENSLEEDIALTIKRDLFQIYSKIKFFYDFSSKEKHFYEHELMNYDLAGPFLFYLMFAVFMSMNQSNKEESFTTIIVFLMMSTVVLILNMKLLRIKITYFQGISLIGYFIAPLTISAFFSEVLIFIPKILIQMIAITALIGSGKSAIQTINRISTPDKNWMILFPIGLLLVSLFCFIVENQFNQNNINAQISKKFYQ